MMQKFWSQPLPNQNEPKCSQMTWTFREAIYFFQKLRKNKMLDFLNLTDLLTTKSKWVLKESKIRQLSLYNT